MYGEAGLKSEGWIERGIVVAITQLNPDQLVRLGSGFSKLGEGVSGKRGGLLQRMAYLCEVAAVSKTGDPLVGVDWNDYSFSNQGLGDLLMEELTELRGRKEPEAIEDKMRFRHLCFAGTETEYKRFLRDKGADAVRDMQAGLEALQEKFGDKVSGYLNERFKSTTDSFEANLTDSVVEARRLAGLCHGIVEEGEGGVMNRRKLAEEVDKDKLKVEKKIDRVGKSLGVDDLRTFFQERIKKCEGEDSSFTEPGYSHLLIGTLPVKEAMLVVAAVDDNPQAETEIVNRYSKENSGYYKSGKLFEDWLKEVRKWDAQQNAAHRASDYGSRIPVFAPDARQLEGFEDKYLNWLVPVGEFCIRRREILREKVELDAVLKELNRENGNG